MAAELARFSVYEAASAYVGAGRCLVADGRPADATPLASAHEIFTMLGAAPSLAAVAMMEGSIA